eukprot:CAMPEP_0194279226 /NCGR_PEP_ID=MMETSP0169-20130528/13700_1 /TAXON_ID=218684 /ORGANISM="Corethron pennatum, Strain L29A3" /LENGTH=405 /DNA_ID=CAMNT_0039023607 /DNA_START=102 /DNA_END=1319 /DNA_ORIENTATION=+
MLPAQIIFFVFCLRLRSISSRPYGNFASEVISRLDLSIDPLAAARRLEGNDDDGNYNYLSGYSVKFQGCHDVRQWKGGDDEDNEDGSEVRLATQRLVRFRLCPAEACHESKETGCSTGFGDYVVDLGTFAEAYLTAREKSQQYACESAAEACGCEGDDDGVDQEECEYECYVKYGYDFCFENDDDAEKNGNAIDARDYIECTLYEFEQADDYVADDYAVDDAYVATVYYIGAQCSGQGGGVMLGLFTDASCTIESNQTFEELSGGVVLPYSSSDASLVGDDCVSCLDQNEGNDGDGDEEEDENAQYENTVSPSCEDLYTVAGRCEKSMGLTYPDNNACSYIEGVKLMSADGIVSTVAAKGSKTATLAICLFTTSTVLMLSYVKHLHNGFSRAVKINECIATNSLS